MRILYIDIDTLRPDHLGCYGYHRNTSPTIDRLAGDGVRFDNCYVSDAPCLPSRAATWTGQFGIHNGVVGHGGTAADPFVEGRERGFISTYSRTSWISQIRNAGYWTATVSPFAERHSAWWWYAGYREMCDPGKRGMESAEDVMPLALDWLTRNAKRDNWFLHVNLWDPHSPYRAPLDFGNPFANDPLPAWFTEEMRRRGWGGFGPHSPQELYGFDASAPKGYPRVPAQIDSMAAVRQWIDGYDTGIRYADTNAGYLLDNLAGAGVLDQTVIIVSSDHGETQGELNVWGDHQAADQITCRVPLIVRWPGLTTPRVDKALHYQVDWAASLVELLGGKVPANWDGRSYARALHDGVDDGRPYLVVSQAAWSCQRGIRFNYQGDPYMCLRTYHDGYKMLEPVMLFNVKQDPHEQHDLSAERPDVVNQAMAYLADWYSDMMQTSTTAVDPMATVLREGGPLHTRGYLPAYLDRLRATGRAQHAERLARLHPHEL
jgi:choline-sulfatase